MGYKFLNANVMFRLPDDFQGTFADALREVAKYMDFHGAENRTWHDTEEEEAVDIFTIWKQFLTAYIETDGKKNLYIMGEVCELDDDGNWSYPVKDRRGKR